MAPRGLPVGRRWSPGMSTLGWSSRAGGAPSGDRVRHEWRPWLTSRTGVGVLTVLVVAALVMTALPSGRPLPSPEPAREPRPPPRPPPPRSPPDGAWGDLALPAWEPVAELDARGQPTRPGLPSPPPSSCAAGRPSPPIDLAAGLTAEPAVAFRVEPGASPAEARLVPTDAARQGRPLSIPPCRRDRAPSPARGPTGPRSRSTSWAPSRSTRRPACPPTRGSRSSSTRTA